MPLHLTNTSALARRPQQSIAPYPAPATVEPAIPTVSSVVSRWGPWTPGMVVLGVADDGLPIAGRLWQKWHKRLDHLLIWGANDYILLRVLEPVLYSMVFQMTRYGDDFKGYNEPMGKDTWQYLIISPRSATAWHPLVAASPLCRGHVQPTPDLLEHAFGRLMTTVRKRYQRGPTHDGREYWPWFILVLDDFGQYADAISQKGRMYFQTLLDQGKEVGIHIFVTARYTDADHVPLIPSRVSMYGAVGDVDLASLPQFRGLEAAMGLPPHRVYIPTESGLMAATIPAIG